MAPAGQDPLSTVVQLIGERAQRHDLIRQIYSVKLGCPPPKEQWLSSVSAVDPNNLEALGRPLGRTAEARHRYTMLSIGTNPS